MSLAQQVLGQRKRAFPTQNSYSHAHLRKVCGMDYLSRISRGWMYQNLGNLPRSYGSLRHCLESRYSLVSAIPFYQSSDNPLENPNPTHFIDFILNWGTRLPADDHHRSPSQDFFRECFHVHKIRLIFEVKASLRPYHSAKFLLGFRKDFWERATS